MTTDLNKLKTFLLPTTTGEVLRAAAAEAATPDEPGFVHALEAEMRDEYLACAHAAARKSTPAEPH